MFGVSFDRDTVRRAYLSLIALRDEVEHFRPEDEVREAYVNQYHDQIQRLERLGYELSEFRVRPDELTAEPYSTSYMRNAPMRTPPRSVEFGIFITRLMALLMYLAPDERPIGFRPPES